jgi:hypothetical protein
MPGPKPQLVAMLLCDRAFQEVGTMKWHVSGAFDTINAPTLPFVYPQFAVFVALSDFSGDAMVQLVIRDQEGGVVKAVRGKIPPIPLGLFQSAFPFPEVEFKTAGVHTLELLAGDDLLALRSFRVQHTSIDPDDEERQAKELAEEHKSDLIKEAREIWDKHAQAKPIALIASAGASQTPWFRQSFETVFGSPAPQMSFVVILDSSMLMRLLSSHAAQVEQWLDNAEAESFGRALPVLIVMKGSVHFACYSLEE